MIELRYASVRFTEDGCVTYFPDGKFWGAQPHDTHHYHVISHRCGYGDDIRSYAREHEVAHHLVCEWFMDSPSPIIWALAHGKEVDLGTAPFEELMAQALQRFVRAGERPIIGDVRWDALKARYLEVLR